MVQESSQRGLLDEDEEEAEHIEAIRQHLYRTSGGIAFIETRAEQPHGLRSALLTAHVLGPAIEAVEGGLQLPRGASQLVDVAAQLLAGSA